MLWLPKWLQHDTPPAEREGVSRRTFLFLGASAAVGALVAPSLDETLGFGARQLLNEHNEPYVAFYKARLYARITIPRDMLVMHNIGDPPPFMEAVRSETARALAEAREHARLAGFRIGDSRWEDADGNVLFKVEANTHAERRRALAAIAPEDRFIVTEDLR